MLARSSNQLHEKGSTMPFRMSGCMRVPLRFLLSIATLVLSGCADDITRPPDRPPDFPLDVANVLGIAESIDRVSVDEYSCNLSVLQSNGTWSHEERELQFPRGIIATAEGAAQRFVYRRYRTDSSRQRAAPSRIARCVIPDHPAATRVAYQQLRMTAADRFDLYASPQASPGVGMRLLASLVDADTIGLSSLPGTWPASAPEVTEVQALPESGILRMRALVTRMVGRMFGAGSVTTSSKGDDPCDGKEGGQKNGDGSCENPYELEPIVVSVWPMTYHVVIFWYSPVTETTYPEYVPSGGGGGGSYPPPGSPHLSATVACSPQTVTEPGTWVNCTATPSDSGASVNLWWFDPVDSGQAGPFQPTEGSATWALQVFASGTVGAAVVHGAEATIAETFVHVSPMIWDDMILTEDPPDCPPPANAHPIIQLYCSGAAPDSARFNTMQAHVNDIISRCPHLADAWTRSQGNIRVQTANPFMSGSRIGGDWLMFAGRHLDLFAEDVIAHELLHLYGETHLDDSNHPEFATSMEAFNAEVGTCLGRSPVL